jgi:hypothetical protein
MNEILEIESKEKGRPIAVAGSRAIVMHKQDESSPNLDLIDLPGLVTAGRSGEETVHDETMSLARSYVRNRFVIMMSVHFFCTPIIAHVTGEKVVCSSWLCLQNIK